MIKKQIIDDVIFEKYYTGERYGFLFEDLPNNLEPTDLIHFEAWAEQFHSNGGEQAGSLLKVTRKRLETNEEFEKRKSLVSKLNEESKKRRQELYLKLKEEFDN